MGNVVTAHCKCYRWDTPAIPASADGVLQEQMMEKMRKKKSRDRNGTQLPAKKCSRRTVKEIENAGSGVEREGLSLFDCHEVDEQGAGLN